MILTYTVVILQMQLTALLTQQLCGIDLLGVYGFKLVIPFIDNHLPCHHDESCSI